LFLSAAARKFAVRNQQFQQGTRNLRKPVSGELWYFSDIEKNRGIVLAMFCPLFEY